MQIALKEVNTDNQTNVYTLHIIDDIAYVEFGTTEDNKMYVMQPSMVKREIIDKLTNFCAKYTDKDIVVQNVIKEDIW